MTEFYTSTDKNGFKEVKRRETKIQKVVNDAIFCVIVLACKIIGIFYGKEAK